MIVAKKALVIRLFIPFSVFLLKGINKNVIIQEFRSPSQEMGSRTTRNNDGEVFKANVSRTSNRRHEK